MLEEIRPPRRAVVVGAGLGALATVVAACSTSGTTSEATSKADSSTPAAAGTSGAPGSGALAKTADVPVGSGVIVDEVVITQPTAGVFEGFSSVCSHAGCKVSEITDGKIICPCHGSEFNLDGTVAKGPAKTSLETKAVSVQGDSIVAG
ncbi:Rieske (2Fe-2S) protein [Mycolicibacterium hodleri]|uniref:Cytochrome bc1 complex Rieske iron-sulfur subunit n=1 Tax=Mycolicibacterium hodleri TaxID=49897 RepID=A0A502E833_9MYCO|nr:Rieske (2Fe-2S) protein [Mycolicibacterium hodleri]TPG33617.1 Rieske (2Fe-2S) protein [Mycolicibacterium hodleri]